jgi:hypothetical protein
MLAHFGLSGKQPLGIDPAFELAEHMVTEERFAIPAAVKRQIVIDDPYALNRRFDQQVGIPTLLAQRAVAVLHPPVEQQRHPGDLKLMAERVFHIHDAQLLDTLHVLRPEGDASAQLSHDRMFKWLF